MIKNVKFIEVRSEIGAGTRGASLGVDAIKIAALDYGSSLFNKHDSVEIKTENQLLFAKRYVLQSNVTFKTAFWKDDFSFQLFHAI